MPATVLRAATLLDLDFITQGERAYMHQVEADSVASWERALERNRELWIANLDRTVVLEVAGERAGYAMWTVAADVATLVTINVVVGRRGLGFGRLLLHWFMADARGEAAAVLKLGVHRDNPAKRLYAGAGFTPVGTDGDYLPYALA